MPKSESELLETPLAAQLVPWDAQLEATDRAKGISTGGYINKAAKAVSQARPVAAKLVSETALNPLR